MQNLKLNLSEFRPDELGAFFAFVEKEKKQNLSNQLKLDIVRGNVYLRFLGDALLRSNKYALFYRSVVGINKSVDKDSKDYLLTLRLCSGSLSVNHVDLIRRGGINNVLVAGTIKQHRLEFDSYSSHWNKIVDYNSSWYRLGVHINNALLKNYGVNR